MEISVIIPVYNTREYVVECIASVVKQSMENIEIIIVDDGSTDGSGELCDELSAKDFRIRVIHQSNKGLSAARNCGILNANGRYLSFIDSDDVIDPSMLKTLYDTAEKSNAKVVQCKFLRFFEKNELRDSNDESPKYSVVDHVTALKNLLPDCNEQNVIACNKLYHKTLFEKLNYPESVLYEDEYIIHHLLYEAGKVAYIDLPLYNYRVRTNSITSVSNIHNMNYVTEAYMDRYTFFKEKGLEELTYGMAKKYMLKTVWFYNEHIINEMRYDHKEMNEAIALFTQLYSVSRGKCKLTYKENLILRLFAYSRPMYRFVFRLNRLIKG